ncbi:kinase-like domain-containing protein [Leucosporidium creatinivorum]|uniref:1-phosphatidylinositol 4-kinase n=1 Tax=Leucosporidium creatinivorum TaxID=106004 RepID=A0A1Y2F0A7_9BASI|nr:kinase-like domain-containing protein [Leucosporidium creatinivorum]
MASTSNSSQGGSGGSALLLRLFESSFFDVHLCVGYLKTYPNSIGITHYLVNRLRSFDEEDVEFYWPQLCYLVITRPTPSVALENFILERCEDDAHIAVITLWYLQSSLSDLSTAPTTDQFAVCRRIFNRVQSIIFTDPPLPSTSTDASPTPPLQLSLAKDKINAPLASFVGLGVLAAAIAMPRLAQTSGKVAIEQGRRVEQLSKSSGAGEEDDDGEDGEGSGSENEDQWDREPVKAPTASAKTGAKLASLGKSVLEGATAAVQGRPAGVARSKSASLSRPKRTQTIPNYLPGAPLEPSPATPLTTKLQTHSHSFLPSPLGGSASTPNTPMRTSKGWAKGTTPPTASPIANRRRGSVMPSHSTPLSSLSVPSLPTATHSASYLMGGSPSGSSTHLSGSNLPGYGLPKAFLSRILLLQACRSQLDLLRSLQDISTRLVLVPKPARLSSLRAELTILNHGLPRGCSLGMSSRGIEKKGRKAQARIVRISPSESVVLNSADRAPFVIHVEVLEGDLDFDPDRRQNAEDLRRALQEREKGVGAGYGGASRPTSRSSLESGGVEMRRGSSLGAPISPLPSPGTEDAGDMSISQPTKKPVEETPPPSEPSEEMDLVEQLYGDISLRDAPIPEPTEEEEEIHNRSVDEQAWARQSALEDDSTPSNSSSAGPATPHTTGASLSKPSLPSDATSRTPVRSASARPATSLDDYAGRMRMAAIMLAQLDASQATSKGVVATGTAAAGTLVGLPVATVAGLGGAVGAGLGAVASRFARRDSMAPPPPTVGGNSQAGQGSMGTIANLDTASAAEGASAIAGAPSLAAPPPSTPGAATSAPPPPAHRPRVLAATDAAAIRTRIMNEMMALEEERMARMRDDGRARSGWTPSSGMEDGAVVLRAVSKDDPSGAVLSESFAGKTARIRAASPYGHLPSWNVISVIVKTGADLRQEQFAIQLIKEFGRIWSEEKCPSWVCYFRILVTSEQSGLIETITDAVSIHSIKKDAYARTAADGTQVFNSFTLYDHYVETYGQPDSPKFRKAQTNFIKSLASYSVICYLLQLKDRHNGNILVDRDGHLIHIDFGFLLSNSPGSIGFEMAPFKLPQDYIDILGGYDSDKFVEFKTLFKKTFRDARKHAERIITLVELMQKDSNLPCFSNGELTSQQLRERFMLSLTQSQVEDFCEKLIINAATSSFTRLYDLFQGYSNGIL